MWKNIDNKLYNKLTFKDFNEAFEFMKKVADVAESLNHHPDWRNVYNSVEITLFTHDLNTLTEKDHELADAIDNILNSGVFNTNQ